MRTREKKNYRNNLFEKFDLFSAKRFAIFMSCHRLCSVHESKRPSNGESFVSNHFDECACACACAKWNETVAIMIATNLVCNIDFFSTRRLHSLPMQYHLHFNVRLESWNGICYFQIHLPNALDNVLVHFFCGSANHQVWFVLWFRVLPILSNAKFEYSGPSRKFKYLNWIGRIENILHRCSSINRSISEHYLKRTFKCIVDCNSAIVAARLLEGNAFNNMETIIRRFSPNPNNRSWELCLRKICSIWHILSCREQPWKGLNISESTCNTWDWFWIVNANDVW